MKEKPKEQVATPPPKPRSREDILADLDVSIRRTKETIKLLEEVAPFNQEMYNLLMHTTGDLVSLEQTRDKLYHTEKKNDG